MRAPIALLAVLLVAGPATAEAATRNGITPLSPKPGAQVPAGKSPLFRMRVTGPGSVWVHVCKSGKRGKHGTICGKEIGEASKSGDEYRFRPKFFDFPGFWLNQPGVWHWQAFRIDCEGRTGDCLQEGPVVRFRVR
jgi:hypothetical protein